jgi:hypothetical protein
MKRKSSAPSSSSSANPSVVLRAFAPETCFTLSLDGWILLEALESNYTAGRAPTMRDTVLAILVMTDEEAVFAARKKGKIEDLIAAATAGKKPSDVLAMADKIAAAFEDALNPSASGADAGEKKSSAAPAGG